MERLYDSTHAHFSTDLPSAHLPEAMISSGTISPDTQTDYTRFFDMIFQGVPCGSADLKMRNSDGEYRWHHADYSLVYSEDKVPLYALITYFDNTKSRELELAAEKWRTSLSSLLADAFLYAEVNLTRDTVELLSTDQTSKTEPALEIVLADVAAMGLDGTVSDETRDEYWAFFNRQRLLGLFAEKVFEDKFDYAMETGGISSRWVQANVRMIQSPHSGDIMAGISFTQLESHQKELEKLTRKAYHDPLTGLLNREGFNTSMEAMLARYDPDLTTALYMIDLDNFKQINDRLGHQVGDMVLARVADTLRATFRTGDIISRLGGDEFIVLLQGKVNRHHLEHKALELLSAVKLQQDGVHLPVSVSIGLVFGRSKLPFERMYRLADIALYTSKKAGKARFHTVNFDTNEEQTFSGQDARNGLVSLQDLLQSTAADGLVKSRTPYEALLENIPGGVVMLEFRGRQIRVINCNDWLYQYLDYPRDELAPLLETDPLFAVHPDDKPLLLDRFRDVMHGQDAFNAVFRMRTRDGRFRYTSFSASLTERKKGFVVMHGIHTDVDNMITMQQELEKARKTLEHMINSIPAGIAVLEFTDRLKTYLYGDWMFNYSGFSREELKALEVDDDDSHVYAEDHPIMTAFYDRFKHGEDYASCTVRLITKHQGPVPVHIKGSVIERTPEKISVYAIFLEG